MKTQTTTPLETDNSQQRTLIICDPPPAMQKLGGYWYRDDTTIEYLRLRSNLPPSSMSRTEIEKLAGRMRVNFPDLDLDARLFKKADEHTWGMLLGMALAGYAKCICFPEE